MENNIEVVSRQQGYNISVERVEIIDTTEQGHMTSD